MFAGLHDAYCANRIFFARHQGIATK